MKKILSLKFDFEDGGYCCGPVDSSFVTEGKFVNENGEEYFVSVTRLCEFANLYVSKESLFKDLINFSDNIDSIDENIAKISKKSFVELSETIGEWSNDLLKSEYIEEMKLMLILNDKIINTNENEWKSGSRYIAKYKNKDIDQLNLPLVTLK